ncbi:MAG: sigma-54 dependent transcriptional regulator [Planctomycetota bacterium]|jgi:DNA-binding NtrC family response regulator|nr:sigma-54 dependent transcriptional regulator [Planctomycetota bacterium]
MDILLVEDERTLAIPLADALSEKGHVVKTLHDGAAALAWLKDHRCELVVTDVRLPGADGINILQRARAQDPPCEVLVMTGYASIDQAVDAMRGGAVSYLQKPFPIEALLSQVERVAKTHQMQGELRRLRQQAGEESTHLTGTSTAVTEINKRIQKVAGEDVTVLITGESGTGKERVARALHQLSQGASKAFVPVACSAIPAGLLEGELFGFRKGAFTGAEEDRSGLLDEAGDGTLFLDDIDDVPLEAQAKLLRVLQEREFMRLGGHKMRPFKARVLAATKVDLKDAVAAGAFREDLYFRINVVPLRLVPLRERTEDLSPLLGALLKRWDPEGRHRIAPEALRKLALHPWPGNVRELENSLRRALALAGRARILRLEHLLPGGIGSHAVNGNQEVVPLREAAARAESDSIRSALAATGGRKQKAAKLLGVSRKVLWQKMKELGLEDPKDSSA